MSKITPLMTSLHQGHKVEERLKCIDNMLFKKCEDTKDTILQAFWWYRKNSISLDRIKQAREEMATYIEPTTGQWTSGFNNGVNTCVEILDKLIAESEVENG